MPFTREDNESKSRFLQRLGILSDISQGAVERAKQLDWSNLKKVAKSPTWNTANPIVNSQSMVNGDDPVWPPKGSGNNQEVPHDSSHGNIFRRTTDYDSLPVWQSLTSSRVRSTGGCEPHHIAQVNYNGFEFRQRCQFQA